MSEEEINPFRTPPADRPQALNLPPVNFSGSTEGIYIAGDELCVRNGSLLPPFCVETGAPVSESEMRKKQFYWCPNWIYILLLLNIFILIVVYLVARKECSVTFGLSAEFAGSHFDPVLDGSRGGVPHDQGQK